MDAKQIVPLIIVIGLIGFFSFRFARDRIKRRQNKKQSDSSETKEK